MPKKKTPRKPWSQSKRRKPFAMTQGGVFVICFDPDCVVDHGALPTTDAHGGPR